MSLIMLSSTRQLLILISHVCVHIFQRVQMQKATGRKPAVMAIKKGSGMKQKQIMMPGTDTDLSRAADDYLDAVVKRDEAEKKIVICKKDLITVMRKLNKDTFIHGGRRIIFRAGHKVESTIVLQKAK